MKTMTDILQLPAKRIQKGLFGVEIEVEGVNLPREITGWTVTEDGSLRGDESFEYVMPRPLDLKGVRNSLNALEEAYAACDSDVVESVRAGVHVHVNVQDFTVKQLFTFATCYYLLEDLLIRWCGEYREGNLFCLRTKDAEYVLFALVDAIQNKNMKYLANENIRYASMNFNSLFKYGSLEFRAMRGTSDLNAIYKWTEILSELRDNFTKFKDPAEVVMSMSGEGEDLFLRKMLPNNYELFIDHPNYALDIRRAARRVQMMAFSTDWDELERKSNNIFDNKEKWL